MPGAEEAMSPEEIVDAMCNYTVPESATVGVVIIGIVFALLMAYAFTRHKWRDQLTKNGLTKEEYPFGADYMVNIVINGAVGAFAAYFASGIILGLMGHEGAPDAVYYFFAFIFGCVGGVLGWQFFRMFVDDRRADKGTTALAVASAKVSDPEQKN